MIKGYVETGDPKYQKWIDGNVPDECRQLCRPKAEAMATEFPELRVVGDVGIWEAHSWCVDVNEKVADPTAHQFGEQRYWYDTDTRLELEDFPKGKCPWCGDLYWPDTPRNRELHDGGETVGPHTHCNKQMEREYRTIEEGGD